MPEGLGNIPDEIKNEINQNAPGEEKPEEIEKQEEKEFELTPKVEEKIMEKVQDIDSEGIAYTVLKNEKPDNLCSIFHRGLLGTSAEDRRISEITPTKWVQNARQKRDAVVYFNIVGRSRLSEGKEPYEREIKQSYHINHPHNLMIILFDINRYKELEPIGPGGEKIMDQKSDLPSSLARAATYSG